MKTAPGILILGMHRSGTSSLAGMLGRHGLHLGEVNEENRFNPKGNQENPVVNRINNTLLRRHGGSWFHPVPIETVPLRTALQIRSFRRKMARTGLPWGVKDPRMIFCLSAWYKPGDRLVGVFRHPAAVMKSLEARSADAGNSFPPAFWERLWIQYNRQLLQLFEFHPFPIVNFSWEAPLYRAAVFAVARGLGLEGTDEDFLDESLVHHSADEEDFKFTEPDTESLYRALNRIAQPEEVYSTQAKPA